MKAAAALVGTRRLVEHVNWDAKGSLSHLFGPHPLGYMIFDQGGHFSVQIMRTPLLAPFASGPEQPTPNEACELLKAYYGAFGTYAVDPAQAVIIFRAEGATRPDLIGKDVRLPYRLADDCLIIGDEKTFRRVWRQF
jgi:hypothetical protein